jgi:small GTP-binding protein
MDKSVTQLMYKVIVVGEIATGKTSLIKQYVFNKFSLHCKSTIGVDFALKIIPWDEDKIVKLQLWDIAGQERFGNMTRVYYGNAVGAIIVCDITRDSTIDAVKNWKNDIDNKITMPGTAIPIPVILLANKTDLWSTEDKAKDLQQAKQKIDDLCKELSIEEWFATSAKTGENIENAANTLISSIIKIKTESGDFDSDIILLKNKPNIDDDSICDCN